MDTPILKLPAKVSPFYGKDRATFFLRPGVCNLDCSTCLYPEQPSEVYDEEEFVNILLHLDFLQVDYVELIGGESTSFVKSLTKLIPMIKEFFPLALKTNGTRPTTVHRLAQLVDGFILDIKVPLKPSYTTPQKLAYNKMIGLGRNLYSYRDALQKSIVIMDPLPFTRYRLTNLNQFADSDAQMMREFVASLKGDFNEKLDGRGDIFRTECPEELGVRYRKISTG